MIAVWNLIAGKCRVSQRKRLAVEWSSASPEALTVSESSVPGLPGVQCSYSSAWPAGQMGDVGSWPKVQFQSHRSYTSTVTGRTPSIGNSWSIARHFSRRPRGSMTPLTHPNCPVPPQTPASDAVFDRLHNRLPAVSPENLRAFATALSKQPGHQFEHDGLPAILLEQAGVVSLSASPLQPVMWSHYSNNHKGFCVGFSSHGILADCADARVQLCPIHYLEDRPDFSDHDFPALEFMKMHLTTKSSGWSYEQEFRLINFFAGENRILRISSDTVMEVYLGYRMPDPVRKEILDAVQAIPDVLVRQVKKKGQSFLLNAVSLGLSQNQNRGPEFKCTPMLSIGKEIHCRIVCPMCEKPDRVKIEQRKIQDLPPVHCRHCGQEGHVFIILYESNPSG